MIARDDRPVAVQASEVAPPASCQVMPGSVWRWLHASVEESAPSPIDAAFLESLAAELNASMLPRPVDGGVGSVVHGTVDDTATLANGWAHRAVVFDEDGKASLYLLCELLPEVAESTDSGRLAFGSIHAEYRMDGDTVTSAELASHALTNRPANAQLSPSTAVRSAHGTTCVRGAAVLARSTEKSMDEKDKTVTEAAMPPDEKKPEEMAAADAPAPSVEELQAQIAEKDATIAALQAELEALKGESMDARESEAALAEKRAVDAVDTAISGGVIRKAAREQWLTLARSSLERFREMTAGMKAAPVGRVTREVESQRIETVDEMSEQEAHLATMLRAGGLPDAKVKQKIAALRARKVV